MSGRVSQTTQVWPKLLSLLSIVASAEGHQISFPPVLALDMPRPRVLLHESIVDKLHQYMDYTPCNKPPCCILSSMEVSVAQDWWRLWLFPIISGGRTLYLNLTPCDRYLNVLILKISWNPDDEVLRCWWAVIMYSYVSAYRSKQIV